MNNTRWVMTLRGHRCYCELVGDEIKVTVSTKGFVATAIKELDGDATTAGLVLCDRIIQARNKKRVSVSLTPYRNPESDIQRLGRASKTSLANE